MDGWAFVRVLQHGIGMGEMPSFICLVVLSATAHPSTARVP